MTAERVALEKLVAKLPPTSDEGVQHGQALLALEKRQAFLQTGAIDSVKVFQTN